MKRKIYDMAENYKLGFNVIKRDFADIFASHIPYRNREIAINTAIFGWLAERMTAAIQHKVSYDEAKRAVDINTEMKMRLDEFIDSLGEDHFFDTTPLDMYDAIKAEEPICHDIFTQSAAGAVVIKTRKEIMASPRIATEELREQSVKNLGKVIDCISGKTQFADKPGEGMTRNDAAFELRVAENSVYEYDRKLSKALSQIGYYVMNNIPWDSEYEDTGGNCQECGDYFESLNDLGLCEDCTEFRCAA